jgi:hypothetical protein
VYTVIHGNSFYVLTQTDATRFTALRDGSDPSTRYEVDIPPREARCTCADFMLRKRKSGGRCKHIEMAMFVGR